MMTYEPPCERSMTITISSNRTEEVIKAIETGHIEGVTLEEYLQVSFLSLMSGDEIHFEEAVMYGGNLITLHTCVSQVNPGQQVSALRKVV